MIIHERIPKSKPKKKTAKQRELAASWQALLKKYPTKPVKITKTVPILKIPSYRVTPHYESLNPDNMAICAKPLDKIYTGDKIKGIGTMHKSNAVPIFNDNEAKDIASMRR